jgi:hypothetical protein
MKRSRSYSHYNKEITVKRVLLTLGAAVLFLTTLVTPTLVKADGGSGTSTGCGGGMCKP